MYEMVESIRIEFNEDAYFEIIDENGETRYLLIDSIYGKETDKEPNEGEVIIREERREQKKRGWRRELKLWEEKMVL